MSGIFSPRALKTMRQTMSRFLVDEVEVYAVDGPQESVFDPDTLTSSPKPGDLVYSGPARVRPTRGPKDAVVGDSVMVLRDADFNLPWDAPEVQRDQMLKVTATEDAQLVDRWFRITDVTVSGQKALRTISGVQIQPSRLWNAT